MEGGGRRGEYLRKATWGGEKCSVDPRPRLSFFFFVLLQDLFFFCAILPRWMVAKGNTESGNGSPLRVADEERNRRVPFDHTRGGGERSGSSFFRSAGGGEKKETWHLFVTPFGFPKKKTRILLHCRFCFASEYRILFFLSADV